MKKFIIFLALVLVLSSCGKPTEEQPNLPPNSQSQSSEHSEEEKPPETEEQEKEVLKLGHTIDFDPSEGYVPESIPANIPFEMPEGLDNGHGENVEIPKEVLKAINEFLPDFDPSDNWHNHINYYTQDLSVGMVEFIYYIDDFISTDKAIICTIENGYITSITARNLAAKQTEAVLIDAVKHFKETHTQEKYVFKEGEEFLSEDVNYIYYYNDYTLVYAYQLFFYMDTPVGKVINNEYFSEYIICCIKLTQ